MQAWSHAKKERMSKKLDESFSKLIESYNRFKERRCSRLRGLRLASNDREKTEVLFLSPLFHLEDSEERKERKGTRGDEGGIEGQYCPRNTLLFSSPPPVIHLAHCKNQNSSGIPKNA